MDETYDDLWRQFIKLTVETFGFQYHEEFGKKEFLDIYSSFKIFSQSKNYTQICLWLFGLYVLNVSMEISQETSIKASLNQYVMCPIIIILIQATKPYLQKYVERETLYYFQNIMIACLGLFYPNLASKGQSPFIFFELMVYQHSIESFPIKLIYILICLFYKVKTETVLVDLLTAILILGMLTFQELQKFTSYIHDYNQIEKQKQQQNQLLQMILGTQNTKQQGQFNTNIEKQLVKLKLKKKKKWGFMRAFEYFL